MHHECCEYSGYHVPILLGNLPTSQGTPKEYTFLLYWAPMYGIRSLISDGDFTGNVPTRKTLTPKDELELWLIASLCWKSKPVMSFLRLLFRLYLKIGYPSNLMLDHHFPKRKQTILQTHPNCIKYHVKLTMYYIPIISPLYHHICRLKSRFGWS